MRDGPSPAGAGWGAEGQTAGRPQGAAEQLALLQAAVEQEKLPVDALIDWAPPGSGAPPVKRTLSMVAAYNGCLEALAWLLARGADPNARSPSDGVTPLHAACTGGSLRCYEAIQLLLGAGADKEVPDAAGCKPVDLLLRVMEAAQLGANSPGATNAEYGLDRPEYCTNEFRMYGFKVLQCTNPLAHDWTECPFAHPGEKARRRDPRIYQYTGVPCPDFRKGTCKRGDGCPFAHGVFECWLHPSRYRTQLCKDAPNCSRKVCFFAHQLSDLREATEPVPCAAQQQQQDAEASGFASDASDGTELQLASASSNIISRSSSSCAHSMASNTATDVSSSSCKAHDGAERAAARPAATQVQPSHALSRGASAPVPDVNTSFGNLSLGSLQQAASDAAIAAAAAVHANALSQQLQQQIQEQQALLARCGGGGSAAAAGAPAGLLHTGSSVLDAAYSAGFLAAAAAGMGLGAGMLPATSLPLSQLPLAPQQAPLLPPPASSGGFWDTASIFSSPAAPGSGWPGFCSGASGADAAGPSFPRAGERSAHDLRGGAALVGSAGSPYFSSCHISPESVQVGV